MRSSTTAHCAGSVIQSAGKSANGNAFIGSRNALPYFSEIDQHIQLARTSSTSAHTFSKAIWGNAVERVLARPEMRLFFFERGPIRFPHAFIRYCVPGQLDGNRERGQSSQERIGQPF